MSVAALGDAAVLAATQQGVAFILWTAAETAVALSGECAARADSLRNNMGADASSHRALRANPQTALSRLRRAVPRWSSRQWVPAQWASPR